MTAVLVPDYLFVLVGHSVFASTPSFLPASRLPIVHVPRLRPATHPPGSTPGADSLGMHHLVEVVQVVLVVASRAHSIPMRAGPVSVSVAASGSRLDAYVGSCRPRYLHSFRHDSLLMVGCLWCVLRSCQGFGSCDWGHIRVVTSLG